MVRVKSTHCLYQKQLTVVGARSWLTIISYDGHDKESAIAWSPCIGFQGVSRLKYIQCRFSIHSVWVILNAASAGNNNNNTTKHHHDKTRAVAVSNCLQFCVSHLWSQQGAGSQNIYHPQYSSCAIISPLWCVNCAFTADECRTGGIIRGCNTELKYGVGTRTCL